MNTLLAILPEPSIGIVVLTGISLVFLVLVALALIITAQGKIFDAIGENKKKKNMAKTASAAPAAPAAKPAPAAPAPVIEEGIPEEVVAAIVAALACMDGGKYQLRALKKVPRGRWGLAGVISDTEPF